MVMLASFFKDPEFANVDSSENESIPFRGTILRTKSGKFSSVSEPCVSCTTVNILSPIYKRLDQQNQNVRESDFRAFWLARNERIVDWLLYESSSIICLQEFWVGNEELVQMYEQRLGASGYDTFKLARTNNRGDGLLTAIHKEYFRVLNYRELLFNDFGDRVAQLLHVQSVIPFLQNNDDSMQQEILIVNTHLLFPHDSSLSIVRLHQVYKILQYLETYQRENKLSQVPVMLCGDWNGSKRGHVYKFLRSQGFVSSYDIAHEYTDSDHKWVSHRNHRGNICGVDFIWLRNPNKSIKPLKISWAEAAFGIIKYQLQKASLNEKDAFDFLRADNNGNYITYSDFCDALKQLKLTSLSHGLSFQEFSSNGLSLAAILTNRFLIRFLFYPSTASKSLPMLKLLSSTSSRVHCLTTPTPSLRIKQEPNSVFYALGRLTGLTQRSPKNSFFRACFCSDSSNGSGSGSGSQPAVEVDEKGAESQSGSDSKASSAIVSTYPKPEDYLTVLALPLPHRPLFPGFYMPIYVKDPKLLAALQESRKRQAPYAGAFLLKDEPGTESSTSSETEKSVYDIKGKELFNRLHEVGTLAQISSIQGDQVILIGHRRLRITEMVSEDPLTVKVDHLKEKPYNKDDDVIKATSFEVISTLRDVLKTSSLWRDHVQTYSQHIGDFNFPRLADFGAAISGANKLQCQQVLEELDVHKRLQLTLELVKKEMEISKIQESIAKAIEEKISGEQRRYLLNEQLKAIKKELGLETDDKTALSAKFKERLEPNREKCPPHVLQVIEEELTKLQLLEASSSEFNVTRNYLDWLTVLPWGNYSDENFDVIRAQTILDEDHYGLTDVKERILEFIAVGKLRGTSQGKIICLSGPPGVGKTSIGRSIARALNRKFFRFSVGGLSDVAEIKGHRRTYIGAMPGKMVQCLKNVGTANPLVLIDEIDKLGRGHAGDPASALLELLDPEQNANFLDHYLDVPIDLSKVLFVCTANVVDNIPNPLLDRMEVIAIAGYIADEKMHIARDYLEKTAQETCGVKPEQVEVTDAALLGLIENYCREAGVRNLQKHIEKIYRKIALRLVREGSSNESVISGEVVQSAEAKAEVDETDQHAAANETAAEVESVGNSSHELKSESSVQTSDQPKDPKDATETEKLKETETSKAVEKVSVDASNLADFVGKPVFHAERIYDQTPVGVVMGLAWTAMGGSTLYIETTEVEQGEGKGALHVTGQLGDVMKESAQIAHTLARTILLEKEPANPFFANTKLHLHVPAGATPKDGPSAGCTMITSLLSLAMKMPVRKDLAMTGEVTLTGKILPIGGVKEKTIAARRSEVKTIIFPSANKRDYDELAPNVREGLDVHFVDDYSQIFNLAFDNNTGN